MTLEAPFSFEWSTVAHVPTKSASYVSELSSRELESEVGVHKRNLSDEDTLKLLKYIAITCVIFSYVGVIIIHVTGI